MSIFKKIFESNDLDINEDVQLNEYGFSGTDASNWKKSRGGVGPRFYGDYNAASDEYEDDLGSSDEGHKENLPRASRSQSKRRSRPSTPEVSPEEIKQETAKSVAQIALAQTASNIDNAIGYLDNIYYRGKEKDDIYELAVDIIKSQGIQKESENKMKSWKEKLFESTGLGLPIMESLMNDDDDWKDKEECEEESEEEMEESEDLSPEQEEEMDVDDDGDIDSKDLKMLRNKNK